MGIEFYINMIIGIAITIGYFFLIKKILATEINKNWWWGLPLIIGSTVMYIIYCLDLIGVFDKPL